MYVAAIQIRCQVGIPIDNISLEIVSTKWYDGMYVLVLVSMYYVCTLHKIQKCRKISVDCRPWRSQLKEFAKVIFQMRFGFEWKYFKVCTQR